MRSVFCLTAQQLIYQSFTYQEKTMTSQLIPNCFSLNFSLNTIQAIRLCAALLETNYDIHFSPEVKPILRHWNQRKIFKKQKLNSHSVLLN